MNGWENTATQFANMAFAIAVAWYLLTKMMAKLDELKEEIRGIRTDIGRMSNRLEDTLRMDAHPPRTNSQKPKPPKDDGQ